MNPAAIATADFNNDGKPDLAVANYFEADITVLLGNGNGGFTAAAGSPFAAGTSPVALAVADLNGDGKADIAVANRNGVVTILLGNGKGGFTMATGSPIPTGQYQLSIAAGDFNGDGKIDLAVSGEITNAVTLLLGDGSGGFSLAPPIPGGSGARFLMAADFNRDGKLDLALANADGNSVTVLMGDGMGNFSPAPIIPVDSRPVALASADFNNDGLPDLAVVNAGSNSVTVLLGDGLGGFARTAGSPFRAGGNPGWVVTADFNGDGNSDLAIANQADNTISVFLGNGSGDFGAGKTFATGSDPVSMVVADFNSDKRPDLAIANSFSNSVTVLLGSNPTSPQWSIVKTHVGSFAPGQNGATYTIAVSNRGGGPTKGTVTVSDTLPAGLTRVSMAGAGWMCQNTTCTRADVLAAGQSYGPITVIVNTGLNVPATLINQATVSGGGATAASATDPTAILPISGVYFSSNVANTAITVDGSPLMAPFTIALSNGPHSIAAPLSLPGTASTSYRFTAWSDGSMDASRQITLSGSQPASYSAIYTAQYVLNILVAPVDGGVISPGTFGIFSAGTVVPVAAMPNTGFVFAYWLGSVANPNSASTTVTMNSGQTITAYFSPDNARFVNTLYADLLNRPADLAGFTNWLGLLNSGALSRSGIAAQFFASPEFSQAGLYVIKLYEAVLKRDPDFGGWYFWFTQLQSGISSGSVLNSFLNSPEFQNLYGNVSNSMFVTLVFQNVLGRAPDPTGYNYWLGLLNDGTYTRSTMFDQFLRSPEYDNAIRARAYANLLYMGFLKRTADPGGLAFWTGSLADPNALSGAIDAFINSPEYLGRF